MTESDAFSFFYKFHEIYKRLVKEVLNIYVLDGEKTIQERFKGAEKTFALEAIMPDGQALQIATTHYLGTNFAEMFDVKYTDRENRKAYPFQLSAGTSTRLIGAMILTHSDDSGLVLPIGLTKDPVKIYVLDGCISQDSDEYCEVSEQLSYWCAN